MSNQGNVENVYLEQVLQQQARVDQELHKSRRDLPGAPTPLQPPGQEGPKGHAAEYRITGFGPWRTVVVSPNVYVIHTRRGHKEPLNIGLGVSFRYIPYTDAFLIIPAAMQTIIINANSICRERQGILVQAYVQWIIDDIKTAYQKLDFSDPDAPMQVVNVQLREQAEAAIKDKVATMSIDEVLSDKQPIIEELTHRLRAVGEGSHENAGSAGLGLKIVTVQIKEAVVSSTRLWENLQAPFRAERDKLARLAKLENAQEIASRELASRQSQETAEIAAAGELAGLRAAQERARYDLEQAEKTRRHTVEQEAERRAIAEQNVTTKARNEAQLELALQELELEKRRIAAEIEKVQEQMQLEHVRVQAALATAEAEVAVEELHHLAEVAQAERDLALRRTERDIENRLSERYIQAQLVAKLPEIAEHLPAPQEQRTTIIASGAQEGMPNPLLNFLASALSLVEETFPSSGKKDNVA
jgi:flotillin